MLVLGPDSSVSPLILAAITPLLAPAATPAPRSRSPGCSRCWSGCIEIGLGLGKLGFVADLLSKEVQVGYMNGLAVTIIVGQLPKLFGFSTDADGFLDEVERSSTDIDETRRGDARSSGVGVLAVLLVLPRLTPRLPACSSRWSAPRSRRQSLGLADHGVATVGALPQGCRRRAPVDDVERRRPAAHRGHRITLVSLTDTIATSASFAARRGDDVEPDQEMIGIGAANIAAGLFQGFAVSTSGSRTAVAEQSGRQDPGSPASSAPRWSRCCCCS